MTNEIPFSKYIYIFFIRVGKRGGISGPGGSRQIFFSGKGGRCIKKVKNHCAK